MDKRQLDPWAEQAGPWVDYLSRTSYLLQHGRNVAGVLYAYGEEAPLTAIYNRAMPADAPVSHEWDFANADVILNRIAVKDGWLVTDSGQRYALLWLGGQSHRLTVPILKRLNELADNGARIGGIRPQQSPSLSDDPAEVARLSSRLWSSGAIVPGKTAEEAMANLGQIPDFVAKGAENVLFRHRRSDEADIYFLTNQAKTAQKFDARFGIAGRVPERWDAVAGTTSPVSWRTYGRLTVVPLQLLAGQSPFLLLGKATAESGKPPLRRQ